MARTTLRSSALLKTLADGAPRIVSLPASESAAGHRLQEIPSCIANGVRSSVLRDGTRDTGGPRRSDATSCRPHFDGLHRFRRARAA
jgi:hypothetical protein